jgi:hypothetical protein
LGRSRLLRTLQPMLGCPPREWLLRATWRHCWANLPLFGEALGQLEL